MDLDRLGNVAALTDGNGRVTDRYAYDPFGNEITGASTSGNPFRYTGRRYDPETGLYFYRARYYDAPLGRFLQTDPIGYEDQWNLYTYVGNDPLNATDPSGTQILGIVVGPGFLSDNIFTHPSPLDNHKVDAFEYARAENFYNGNIPPRESNFFRSISGGQYQSGGDFLRQGALTAYYGLENGLFGAGSGTVIQGVRGGSALAGNLFSRFGAAGVKSLSSAGKVGELGSASSGLVSQQLGTLSRSGIQRYVDLLRSGGIPKPVVLNGNRIIEGHHRLAASRITGIKIPSVQQPGALAHNGPLRNFDDIGIGDWR